MEDRDLLMRVATLEQQNRETSRRVDRLEPMLMSISTLSLEVGNLRGDFSKFMEKMDARDAREEARKEAEHEAEKEERRSFKRSAFAAAVAIFCALLGAAGAILTAVPH